MTRIVVAAVLATGVFAAPQPADLDAMVGTERAFARRAAEVGVRDSFLEFFAEDAIRFAEAPAPAKPFFRALAAQPPSAVELTWSPRVGDMAASGELGYLTGPAMRIVHADPPRPPASLCYFSIWKKQSDGTFKVFIDQGISTPEPAAFPAAFTRADARDRFTGDAATARATLERADRALTADAARQPLGDVYKRALASDGRVYRDGVMPVAGDSAVRWLASTPDRRMSGESLNAEAAKSGDLGYTYGRYTLTSSDPGGDPERGHYVRVWTRTKSGQWKLAFDVTAPAPPK